MSGYQFLIDKGIQPRPNAFFFDIQESRTRELNDPRVRRSAQEEEKALRRRGRREQRNAGFWGGLFRISRTRRWTIILWLSTTIVSIMAIPLTTATKSISKPRELLPGVILVLACPLVVILVAEAVKAVRRRQERRGQILVGRIVDANADFVWGDWTLTAEYEFLADSGQRFGEKIKIVRNDLKGKPTPTRGTPIYVLYRDEKHFYPL